VAATNLFAVVYTLTQGGPEYEVDREERAVWRSEAARLNVKDRFARRWERAGRSEDRHDEDTLKGGEPFEQAAEVVAGGGVAVGSGEVVSAHAVLRFRVADDRFDGGTAAQLAFDGLGDAASLAGDIDPELVAGWGVVAAIAAYRRHLRIRPRLSIVRAFLR
jgi:hypothetical protein